MRSKGSQRTREIRSLDSGVVKVNGLSHSPVCDNVVRPGCDDLLDVRNRFLEGQENLIGAEFGFILRLIPILVVGVVDI